MTRTAFRLVAVAAAAWATAAIGQTAAPAIPNPAHPFPDDPVATDGTSLRSIWPAGGAGSRQAAEARPIDAGALRALSPARVRRAR